MLHRKLYWLTLCLLGACHAFAQHTVAAQSMAEADAHSYQLYLDKNWKELEGYAEEAIKAGYDYYYMRMRAGIATYQNKHYRKAIRHFRKALGFNSGDETATVYLYNSYVYAAQYEEARNLYRRLDTTLTRRIDPVNRNALSFLSIEAAMKFSDSASRFSPATYIQVAGQHYVRNRLSLFHALTYYGQEEYRQKIRQYQYYISAAIPLKNQFILSPAIHAVYDDLEVREISTTTVAPMPPLPGQPPPPAMVKVTSKFVARQTSAVAGALTLTKKMSYFDLALGITACSFDTARQYQVQATWSCYPFANRKLAFGAAVCHHTETDYRQSTISWMPFVSSLVHPRLLLSASWLKNQGGNIAENNAYLINNSIDPSLSRINVSAELNVGKRASVYGVYSYDTRKEKFEGYHYHYHLALLGLKFIP